MTASALDDVPGLGQARRQALLKHFGSVKRLRRGDASSEIARGARASGRRLHAPTAIACGR